MKKFIILCVILLVSSSALFAQTKAGRIDNTPHPTFYNSPKSSSSSLNLSPKETLKVQVAKVRISPVVVNSYSGSCPFCKNIPGLSPKEEMKAEVARIYSCSMQSDIAYISSNKSARCPQCGMASRTN